MNIADEWSIINASANSIPVQIETIPISLNVQLRYAYLEEELSGMIENNGQFFTITVNANDWDLRQRFTLAHELGHYMLHRHLIGNGLDDDRAYRSTKGGRYHNIAIGPTEEAEANRFAANLLMPINQMKAYKDNSVVVEQLADKFQVSNRAMEIRLTNLKIPFRTR
ncbi:MAG: ImmA/IrrE family metallo-endopeptidase [Aestuariivita sp.]|nr:ImmA/IrrE family metallo-endopeptidase [Aestuariivita sp.]